MCIMWALIYTCIKQLIFCTIHARLTSPVNRRIAGKRCHGDEFAVDESESVRWDVST